MTACQLDWIDESLSVYSDAGLIEDGRAAPLYEACPACGSCWPGKVPRPAPEDATISLPWRGPDYDVGGVAGVGINFNQYGGLGGHWWIRNEERKLLLAGRRRLFSYRAGSYLAMIGASRAGAVVEEVPSTESVAAAWDAAAFLEAVKCSPATGVGQPTETMWANCPPRYLATELQRLAPSAIVAIGRQVSEAVAELLGVAWDEVAPGFTRGRTQLVGRTVEVFGCNHPSYGHWKQTTPLLAESLRQRPAERF